MLIPNGDGTYTLGPYDLLCIQHDLRADTYHSTLYEEKPMPGPVDQHPGQVRLKSKAHHTIGAETFEGALVHLEEMAAKLTAKPEQIWRERSEVVEVMQAGPDVMLISPQAVGA